MNYPIPKSLTEMITLSQQPVSEELVASAIAGVIQIARSQHLSLEDLKAEVLADDCLLSLEQRLWLSELVVLAWNGFS
ncbi:hypothetical protein M595_3787 [Lyngbya aestuarii BL J]|uniref:Uncharacterized protein n=1 Tax=Lyngbya aestuarii BL J TaxID=1348334 RepID=U7QIM8_9CYAN|nr:hypothetical protein [Lyngbya aestuarii]ERT06286.1 hypothetical protein M595_3787 [Lyngbya aestuarii BL J]